MTDDNYNSYEEPKVCNHYNYKLEGDHWSLREDSFRDKNLITTPGWIVKDMLDLLPDSVWNTETTFLIPCIKSGNFAIEVKNRLMKCKDAMERFPSDEERRDHIDSKQLFCIYWYTEEEFDKNLISGHIWGVNGFLEALYSQSVNLMCTDDLNFDTFKDKTGKKQEKLLESIKEKFGTVKFDVVIGNPPYNNDLYIDFVEWGHQRASKYSLWITPAKWQAKGGEKNERFRKDIVPYISKIVYYPMASDVFNIAETGGISYYLIDKVKHNSRYQAVTCDNTEFSEKMHQTNDTYLYNSIINRIMKNTNGRSIQCRLTRRVNSNSFLRQYYLHESYKPLHVIKDENNNIEVMSGGNIKGYCNKNELYTIENIEKYKVIIPVMVSAGVWACIPNYGTSPLTKLKPYQVPIGSYPIIAFFDTEKECNSFLSYCDTKLVKLLHYIGISATTESSDFWRFVPDPGEFDHEFTDEELYKKYKLTPEEINIIELVIKERK